MAVSVEVERLDRVGVCAPLGFRTGAAAAGVRGDGDEQRLDVALIYSEAPASAAGVFTRNAVKAAPVVISQLTLRRGTPIGAVVVNAGNANACTGAQGFRDALLMCATAGDALGLDPWQVLVCSTGVIGRPMPMARVVGGITQAAALADSTGNDAARAIMTTDTRPKLAGAGFEVAGVRYSVGGIAKGAGMIHPDMATLLAFMTTDAPVSAAALHTILTGASDETFNCVTVDGDTSPNDAVLLLANGAAGGPSFDDDPVALAGLDAAVCA
ncbi:MAG: bifunctional ornithine acetyltransferase/N-acetylglutamate synthase, partial [Candidatus Dormibacteraeota bacterium]|nr:bifunctional ornithine acetyltransferase/N-acetylglutamate synthase [Candidatus Dormibacteraeota bacterium]